MEIECYICDEKYHIDKLFSHLRSHTELEGQIAAQKNRKARLKANASKPTYAEGSEEESLKTDSEKPQTGTKETA